MAPRLISWVLAASFLNVFPNSPPQTLDHFGLRQTGLEESPAVREQFLERLLAGAQEPYFTAGGEETALLAPPTELPLNQRIQEEIAGQVVEALKKVSVLSWAKLGTPALVMSEDSMWRIHIRLSDRSFLFHLTRNREGRIAGVADPMGEYLFDGPRRGVFVRLDGRIDPIHGKLLAAMARNVLNKNRLVLEAAMRGDEPSPSRFFMNFARRILHIRRPVPVAAMRDPKLPSHLLAEGIRPDTAGLFIVVGDRATWISQGYAGTPRYFRRVDLPYQAGLVPADVARLLKESEARYLYLLEAEPPVAPFRRDLTREWRLEGDDRETEIDQAVARLDPAQTYALQIFSSPVPGLEVHVPGVAMVIPEPAMAGSEEGFTVKPLGTREGQDLVVVEDVRQQTASWIAFVPHPPDWIELTEYIIHPNHPEPKKIAQAFAQYLEKRYPGLPVLVHEENLGMQLFLKSAFPYSKVKRNAFPAKDRLWSRDGVLFSGEGKFPDPERYLVESTLGTDSNAEAVNIRSRMDGELSELGAAIRILELLERVVGEKDASFTKWGEARGVLLLFNKLNVTRVRENVLWGRLGRYLQPLLNVLEKAKRHPDSALQEVSVFFEQFIDEHAEIPSSYLANRWLAAGDGLESGLEEPQKKIGRGWVLVEHGYHEKAAGIWLQMVQVSGIEPFRKDVESKLASLASNPRTRRAPLPEVLVKGLALMDNLLGQPELESHRGRSTLDLWRQQLVQLRIGFPARASAYGQRVVPEELAVRLAGMAQAKDRLKHLREQAGFQSPHDLEQEAEVSWATISRAEAGTRGMGSAGSRDKTRFVLETKLNLPLTLTFKPLELPFDPQLNKLETSEERFRFILEDLLGWSFWELVRRANRERVKGELHIASRDQLTTFEQMRPWARRMLRRTLQNGLQAQFGEDAVKLLDGSLKVWNVPVQKILQNLPDVPARLDWLMNNLLIWSGNELQGQAGFKGHGKVHGVYGSRRMVRRWAKLRTGLETGLKQMGQEVVLDENLLAAGDGLESGMEEFFGGQPDRREFLGQLLGSWMGSEIKLLELLNAGLSGLSGLAAEDTLRFLVLRAEPRGVEMGEVFETDPARVVLSIQRTFLDLQGSLDPSEDSFGPNMLFDSLEGAARRHRGQVEHLSESWEMQLDDAGFLGSRLPSIRKGEGNAEELIRYWKIVANMVLMKQKERASPLARLTNLRLEHLAKLEGLPRPQRVRILSDAFKQRAEQLESLLERIRPNAEQSFKRFREERAAERELAQERMKETDSRLKRLTPRVPPGGIFIALVPAGRTPAERGIVDDWPLIQAAVERDPELKGLTLMRLRLLPGEDVVTKAREIALRYSIPGRQFTIGIGLGVLPEDRAKTLYTVWPGSSLDTKHPLLGLSFVYTPEEWLLKNREAGSSPMPSLSSQFKAWLNHGKMGLIEDFPLVQLPQAVWDLFEQQASSHVRLEQAA